MLLGILVGIAAVVVLAIAAIILYIAVKNRENDKPKTPMIDKVESLETVGVAPEDHLNPDARVGGGQVDAEVDPYKHLRTRFRAVGIFVAAAFSVFGREDFFFTTGNLYLKDIINKLCFLRDITWNFWQ